MDEKMILVEQGKIDMILQILKGLVEAQKRNGGAAELRWYDSKETADILGVSESTLKNLRRDGRIDFIQDGRVIRFTWDQIMDYKESKTMKKFKI